MNRIKYKVIFFGVSIIHIIGILIENDLLRNYSKPLILGSLLLYYWNLAGVKNKVFVGALIFSLLGDIFLISDTEFNFMLGLGSFLIAHILYIILVAKDLNKSSLKNKVSAVIPFGLYYAGLLLFLIDNLGDLLIPVIIYGLVLASFGAVSLLNYLDSRTKTSQYLLFGSLFFILSDSVLAINKFNYSNEFFPMAIMITYILAQYLICQYAIHKER